MTTATTVRGLPGGFPRRFGFRFLAAYFLIYNAGNLLRLLPFVGRYSWTVESAWTYVVLGTERHVLGMTTLSSLEYNGSGDTSFLWARNGCMLALALAAALVWSCFDRRRLRDPLIAEAVRIGIRYTLAATLFGYGISKLVPPIQFPPPSTSRLLEPIGRLSPMGMLWVFMGASRAYVIFSGVMEVIGGALLLLRRTTPLGALVSGGVILNIVLLNFCYDVPVKLFSMNLLLAAGYLAWPDLKRVANVLVLNQAAEPARLAPPWKSPGSRIGAFSLKTVVIGTLLLGDYRRIKDSGPEYTSPSATVMRLTGIWEVEKFTSDGTTVPPLLTDDTRWNRVLFDPHSGGLMLVAIGAHNQWLGFWNVTPQSTPEKLVLLTNPKESKTFTVSLTHGVGETLELSGPIGGHTVSAVLRPAAPIETRLFNRGFHWISEQPFNR
jgi:uncharacterized membrane protein YphA (DoxX/SURF4 family)